MPKTPTSILVVSILGILYSALYVLGTPCGLYFTYHPLAPNPAVDELLHDRVYVMISLGSGAVNFCLGVLLLVSSIGSLKLKRWARTGMNAWAWTTVVMTIGGAILTFGYVLPHMDAALKAAGAPTANAAQIGGFVAAVFGLLFALVAPIVILIVFNLRRNIDAFNGLLPVDPNEIPGQDPPQPRI